MKNQKGLTLPGTIVLVLLIAFIVFGVIYFIRIQTAKEGLENRFIVSTGKSKETLS